MALGDPIRVGVLIDWQNCYRSARDAFGFKNAPGVEGQVSPLALAKYLAAGRGRGGAGQLTKLRIYTGAASQKQDPETYAANRRQFSAWENSDPCVQVIRRTLNYRGGRGREKGVDVAIAIDLVRTTLFEPEHDVVILVSADTDLLPALELVVERNGEKSVEVATWKGSYPAPAPLSVKGASVWQHRLNYAAYEKLRDPTSYAVMPGTRPAGSR